VSAALIVVLAFYAVFTPALFYGLWRLTWPAHRRKLPVPGVLIDDTMSLTSDSDYVGLI
jgi:hypothetical protein